MNKRVIGTGVVAAAMAIAVPFIGSREGNSLKAYRDVVGIWTICHGVTEGVKPGMVYTKPQCDKISATTIGKHMDQVTQVVKVPLTPATLAAHTSFHYNIGHAGYLRSSALKYTNENRLAEGCMAMLKWYTAGGRDCRVRANGCYGVWNRRLAEKQLCIEGLR